MKMKARNMKAVVGRLYTHETMTKRRGGNALEEGIILNVEEM